jgi:prepilin-type N-terminal cleavage/methylation domain-containing protein
MRRQQSGFTLVEIAIVLVIIGLLLGGVLKGQELINQAKVKNIANDINGIGAAVYAYQDRYKALPGDDNGAQARWGLAAAQNGDRDGALNSPNANNADETRLFWLHLRKAGLISGDANSDAPPFNAVNGPMTIHSSAAGFNGVVVCSASLPGKIAEAVDSQFDDGKANCGTVRATAANDNTTALAACSATATATAYLDDGTSVYRICKQI